MSKNEPKLNKVVVKFSPQLAISTDFVISSRSESEDKQTENLLLLSSDWAAYCLAAMSNFVKLIGAHSQLFQNRLEKQLLNELRETAAGWSDDSTGGERSCVFVVHDDEIGTVSDLLRDTAGMARAVVALQRSTISALLAELDFFLARLLSEIKDIFPEELIDRNEKYSLTEIEAAGGVEEFRINLIAKKIDDKLRGSHAAVFEWVVKSMQLSDSRNIMSDQVFRDFVEVCQRRHILTHNGGVVNSRYIEECVRAGISQEDLEYKVGDKVEVSPRYLKRAIGRVFLTGYFIIHMIIQKRSDVAQKDSLRQILNTAHAFLKAGHTKICARLCDFALRSKKAMDRDLELRFAINRALAELHDPSHAPDVQLSKSSDILGRYDWTVVDEVFRLAHSCVRREFGSLIPLARAAAAAGLTYGEVQNFAVFKEARKVDGFLECFPRLKNSIPVVLPDV